LVVSSKFCQGQYSIIEWKAKESSTNESKDTLVPSESPEATIKNRVCYVGLERIKLVTVDEYIFMS
jgi:hypothetical protein